VPVIDAITPGGKRASTYFGTVIGFLDGNDVVGPAIELGFGDGCGKRFQARELMRRSSRRPAYARNGQLLSQRQATRFGRSKTSHGAGMPVEIDLAKRLR